MKLLSSAAHPTLSCSASFPEVRVSLRKSLLLEAMTSYFYPLHLVCGLMGLCCYAGGEQWNSLDDDFWAHMRRQWGWEAGRAVRAKIDGPKSKVCSGRNLDCRYTVFMRCSSPHSSWGPSQGAVTSQVCDWCTFCSCSFPFCLHSWGAGVG